MDSGGVVRGILLDSSLFFESADHHEVSAALLPGADYILRNLRYSNIPVALSHGQALSTTKACLLQQLAKTYSYHYFLFDSFSMPHITTELARTWEDNGGSFIHVFSNSTKDLHTTTTPGWFKVIVGPVEEASTCTDTEFSFSIGESNVFFIHKLEELPLLICCLNKKILKALGKEITTVAYVMKSSREEDFAKRGAFPLCPSRNGLIFLPLSYDLHISSQLEQVDAVLHKATDEIVAVDMSSSLEISKKVTFTRNLEQLKRYTKCQPDCCVIDPFNNIFPILDRLKIQLILTGLETINIPGHCKIRAPRFIKVDRFDEPNLEQRLAEAKLSLPNIVKPQVACGVVDAHSMAIVFNVKEYKDLSVPLPAVVQEYVDHSSVIYKFYALGGKIFHAVKKSIPNADILMKLSAENGLKPLLFDSLKSLPVTKELATNNGNQQIDLELVTDAANWLRKILDLTIFGFDVVVQEGSGDHVIVDVNYLPSFKEVPDDVAIPAFWDALKEKIVSHKSKSS